jgi:hypothetical protein
LSQAGCCVASCCAALLSSCCAALLSSPCPLTAPPSRCLISPAGCCVASPCTALLSSSHSVALVILHRLVVALPLVAPPSCPLLVLSLRRRPLVISSHQLVVALPPIALPSHHPLTPPLSALLLSCNGWLLHCLSLHHPLVLLLCRPLLLLLSSTLNLSSLGFPDPFDVTFVVLRERSSRTSVAIGAGKVEPPPGPDIQYEPDVINLTLLHAVVQQLRRISQEHLIVRHQTFDVSHLVFFNI